MRCPYCSSESLRVTNKRSSPDGIRRRRECLKCKKRFTTYERIESSNIFVIKKDGRRELFNLEKIKNGLVRAFEKRPISIEQIEKIAQEIEEQIRKKGQKEIKSSAIGELVMRRIKKVDNIAYIRFASVYREFKHPNDFKREIKEL